MTFGLINLLKFTFELNIKSKLNIKVVLSVNCKLTFAIGTCHLPLQGLNHVLLLLIFNKPWKEFRLESRNEALCALGKIGRIGLQMDIFMNWFYESSFFLSSHIQKSNRILHSDDCSSWIAEIFLKNMYLIACTPPSPNSHICWHFPVPLRSSFLELSEMLSPGQ